MRHPDPSVRPQFPWQSWLLLCLWISFATRLFAVDLDPAVLAKYEAPGVATTVEVSENHAYVTFWDDTSLTGRLEVVSLQMPANPRYIGSKEIGGYPHALKLSGRYAYVVTSSVTSNNIISLSIVDKSDPANLTVLGRFDSVGEPGGLAVSGTHAYLATGYAGVQIIDISDPARPQLASGYQTPDSATDIAIFNSLAYVAAGWDVEILDIGDTAIPQRVGLLAEIYGANISVSDRYLFIGDGGSGLQIFDLARPTTPPYVGAYQANGGLVFKVQEYGGLAYVSAGPSGLHIIDVIGQRPERLAVLPGLHVSDVAVFNNFVCALADGALQIINPNRPANPQIITKHRSAARAVNITISGSLGYLVDGEAGLQILDLANPLGPIKLATHNPAPGHTAWDVAVSDNYAYLGQSAATWSEGGALDIVDVSDPGDPRRIGRYHAPGSVNSVAASGERVYLAEVQFLTAEQTGLLEILDCSNPANPVRISEYKTDGALFEVALSGQFAYLAARHAGLLILDISDPSNPQLAARYDPAGFATGIKVEKNFGYVLAGGGLEIVDLSNPRSPRRIALYSAPDIWDVAVSGNYAYTVGWINGLRVLDIQNHSSPSLIGGNSRFYAYGVGTSNGKLFVAGDDYLYVLHEFRTIRFERLEREAGGAARLRFSGPPNVPAYLQRSYDLRNWSDGRPITFHESQIDLVDNETSNSALFYRIAVP